MSLDPSNRRFTPMMPHLLVYITTRTKSGKKHIGLPPVSFDKIISSSSFLSKLGRRFARDGLLLGYDACKIKFPSYMITQDLSIEIQNERLDLEDLTKRMWKAR
jgi:hypothetical protein